MTLENCYLSFYKNEELHLCNIWFYDNGLLKIEKNSSFIEESFSKKQLNISEDGVNFNIKINLTLRFTVSIRKISLSSFCIEKLEVLIKNKDTNQQLKLYVPKSTENYLKLYNFFKSNCYLQRFDQYFSTSHLLKYPSEKQKAQYYLVQQKLTLKNKMVKRYSKQEFGFESQNKIIKMIQIQNKLNCKGIMHLQAFFQDTEFIYIVCNELPSQNLKQFVKNFRDLQQAWVKAILKQLLEASLDMQINGIVHNNIKPATIQMINDKQNWRCCINHFSNAVLLNDSTLQSQNNIVRNYGYSAPEILRPKIGKLSSKSDVFSIGVLFYFLLLNKEPFKILTPTNKLFVETYSQINFNSAEMDKLSFEACDLLKRMLQFNPDKRISIIDALKHRYFTNHPNTLIKSLTKSSRRSRQSIIPPKHDYTQSQSLRISCSLRENTDPVYNTTGVCGEKKQSRLKFSHFRRKKTNFPKKMQVEGEIDSEDIDDTHISLEPRNSNIMTPSYELKKTIEFTFFTV